MHFSTQHSAAFAVALFCTSSIASGVTAAPVPKGNLEQAEHAAGIANELAQAYSTIHQKREPEPEPLNIGTLLKDGENLLSSILKREPEPEPLNIGTLLAARNDNALYNGLEE